MRCLFFGLLILPIFVFAEDLNKDLTSQKQEFDIIKEQIIFSLQKSTVKKEKLSRFFKIIADNKDYLLQDSTQDLLKEFVNSDRFHKLALTAGYQTPYVYYGAPIVFIVSALKTALLVDMGFGYLPITDQGLIATGLLLVINLSFSIGLTSFLSVMALEELTDLMITSKFQLKKNSRPSIASRSKDACKKLWSGWTLD